MARDRRDFLARAAALTAGGLARRLVPLSALGAATRAAAQAAHDYKALVCVFLGGGVDGNNLVVPTDSAGYAAYSAIRTVASNVNIARGELLPIQPASGGAYGLHPGLAEIHPLFAQGKLAIIANVGTLNEPTNKANYFAVRPDNLFSHSDQVNQWHSSVSEGPSRTGWGGRIADHLAAQNAGFPVATSTAGINLFVTGNSSSPLALPTSGGLALQGYGNSAAANARLAALNAILGADREHAYVKAAGDITARAISLSSLVNPILTATNSAVTPIFAGLTAGIAQQLRTVARLIEARAQTGARRQVFFVSLGGFDTHANQVTVMDNLMGQVSPALKAFYEATVALGVSEQVTTFTLSDFGRTFQPASGGGTDHGWGNHHFVLGGAVRGGTMHGRYPVLARGGPDDADTAGRWIPGFSVEQYGATLARWFGLSPAEIASVFPNLARFSSPDLGFL
jgi:uncharacterized protein (DUF1501 family)